MSAEDAGAALKQAADDFRAEADELYKVLEDADTGYWTERSTFKDWTVWDVIAHLHLSDHMALTTLRDGQAFRELLADIGAAKDMREYSDQWLAVDGHSINGPDLLQRWHDMYVELHEALLSADPEQRFDWAGPGMKPRMFATARQMETWAHGWEIYDLMRLPRTHTDRLRNVAEIGVRTYGWTFANRKLEVPEPAPRIALTSPSGATWAWNEATAGHSVTGDAVEFCQVVTQVRNVEDTSLEVAGDNAAAWMAIAQCFAGPPEQPPAPGSRVPQPR